LAQPTTQPLDLSLPLNEKSAMDNNDGGAGPIAKAPLGHVRLALIMAIFMPLAGAWLLIPRTWRKPKRAVVLVLWRLLLTAFRIKIVTHGQQLTGPGVLFVSNHVSWTDIPVLGRVTQAAFVAKADVRGWPVVGKLTEAYGCLFIDRERRGRAAEQAEALGSHLNAESSLVLFAEGTTGLGRDVLPFRSSLLAMVPQGEGGTRVQPITLRYRHPNGAAFDDASQRQVAWIGDDELMPHVKALAQFGGLLVEVWFEEPVQGANRKELTRAAQAAVAARLAQD
jgi:1-acyl-sn-glycerol-3-phosphate acyltransferase